MIRSYGGGDGRSHVVSARDKGDSLAACRVVVATADRGVTAPAQEGTYAQADADAGVECVWWRQREGPNH